MYLAERKAKLLWEADRLERERFKKQIVILQDAYQKDEVRNRVKEAFAALFGIWNREEPAVSLGIHYLFSNIHRRIYAYQLALYGEGLYLDEQAVELSWEPERFFALLEEDTGEILKQMRGQFPRICPYEEKLIRHHCVKYYHAAVYQLCKDILPEIMEGEAFRGLKKTDGVNGSLR